MDTALPPLCVLTRHASLFEQAQQLASHFDLSALLVGSELGLKQGPWQKFLSRQASSVLVLEPSGLSLWDRQNCCWVSVDFVSGSVNHRRKFGGGTGQLIAKAVGVKASFQPRVVDATAGMGADAFVLASLGCEVRLLERNPIVYQLLKDGLARAQYSEQESRQVISRMQLLEGDSKARLAELEEDFKPDVVYLDPMYPSRKKSASVKKDMAVFHSLVGADPDSSELLQAALAINPARVVVKRPKTAEAVAGAKVSHTVESKNSRYDVYVLRALAVDEVQNPAD